MLLILPVAGAASSSFPATIPEVDRGKPDAAAGVILRAVSIRIDPIGGPPLSVFIRIDPGGPPFIVFIRIDPGGPPFMVFIRMDPGGPPFMVFIPIDPGGPPFMVFIRMDPGGPPFMLLDPAGNGGLSPIRIDPIGGPTRIEPVIAGGPPLTNVPGDPSRREENTFREERRGPGLINPLFIEIGGLDTGGPA
eukprot:Gregarina_sp_Poly_1__2252@NODE_15_length_23029_cov_81_474305_g13_i0_p16_GENE_NODE_15_length_23029_cov_81_474305_g13_i0NODE_15_length_23029_cov_81_474305_g13_i0_p16_ORF_typecomplete_len192_score32_21_NODE_15_length_23029_cov_81_474305_g13_i01952020095